MDMFEIRPNPNTDPEGRHLDDFLVAHLVHERAAARRVFLAHVTAFLGVPVWLCATISSLRSIREVTMGLFAIAAVGLIGSLIGELRCVLAVREAAKPAHARRVG